MKRLIHLSLVVFVLLFGFSACNGSQKDAVPHSDVSAAELTDEHAQEIMAVIVPKQFEIFTLFNGDVDVDGTQACPLDEYYVLVTDERFDCVQDIRDFVLETMTEDAAKEYYFNRYLSGEYNPDNDGTNQFIDYEGKLYFGQFSGSGFAYEMRPETSRIVERTENTVKIEMNTMRDIYTDDGWLYTPTLVKTKDGWRVDCSISSNEGRYVD